MGISIKDIGKMVKEQGKESMSTLMGTFTKVNGLGT